MGGKKDIEKVCHPTEAINVSTVSVFPYRHCYPWAQFTHGDPSFPWKPGNLALVHGVEDLDSLAFGGNEAIANVKIPTLPWTPGMLSLGYVIENAIKHISQTLGDVRRNAFSCRH